MASTYSTNLRLELIGTGEQQGTWGATTNTNLGTLLEEAIGGYTSVTVSDVGDTTLTTNNGSADQARNMVINLTGTISAARNVICPAIEKVYIVRNATTGGYAVTFKVSGQTGVSIPNGTTALLYVNGTDAVAVNGTMAAQAASNVSITGGSISGVNLSSSNVTITGGSISGLSNLSVANATVAAQVRTNLGLGTGDSPQFTSVEIGNASDTTLSRVSAGVAAIEGKNIALNGTGETLTTGTIELGAASDTTISRVSAGRIAVESVNVTLETDVEGQQTIWIPAGAMTPTTTSGAASGSTETTTNDVMIKYLAFDAAAVEKAQAMIQMPKSWDEGTIVAQFVWSQPAGSGNVVWGIRGVGFANDDALDTAFGTAQTVTSNGGTANDCYISSETSAMTVAGSPGAEELVCYEVYRDATNGSDTLAVDAWLIGVKLHYTTDAATDN